MKRILLLIVVLISLISCEGERTGKGIVFDKSTNKPLDSVVYYTLDEKNIHIEYTDSLGNYFVMGDFGGCFSECPDFTAEFSKTGYKTLTIKNPNGDIYLELE